jgi:hypothetical protein
MEPEQGLTNESFSAAFKAIEEWFFPAFNKDLSELAQSPTAPIGALRGPLGQIPYNCSLRDCCDYALDNGLRHLKTLANAMDSPASTLIRNDLYNTRDLIIIDLGSGPGLSWLLFSNLIMQSDSASSLTVINIDHAIQMHAIARKSQETACQLRPTLHSADFRFSTNSDYIDSISSDDLDSEVTIILILNHILHQRADTKENVPNFVSQALKVTSNLAARSGCDRVLGVSIEPFNLRSGFGQEGLKSVVRQLNGSAIANSKIPGDRAGKNVFTFKF